MKITAFNGSPRGGKGNTHWMTEPFLEGARETGAQTEVVFLAQKNIRHCLGCFSCWTKTPGKCVIEDDMRELLPKITGSDIIVLATPLYVDNVTGLMKNFLDRCVPLADPHFAKDENGECRHVKRIEKVPKLVVLSNCGFPEQSHFQVLKLCFRRLARNMHSEVIGEIYRGGGEILQNGNLLLALSLARYRKLLKTAGGEVVREGRISQRTAEELEKPLIPDDRYIKEANKHWDKVLAELARHSC
jgi:multimeric flavodoxin WrbA